MPRVLAPAFVAAALLTLAPPLLAQKAERDTNVWRLEGLRSGYCVQLLLASDSPILHDLPPGVRPVPASEVRDLHVSLKSVIQSQAEYGSWSPSRLCFQLLDTIRTSDFILADRSGKHPQLFGTWTVTAAVAGGHPQEVALDLFANSGRLVRSAKLNGQAVREATLDVGKVPLRSEDGLASTDDRVQVKIGKTTVTWDGHLAGDSAAVSSALETSWTSPGERGREATGKLTLTPAYSRAMAGSLKVDGKDAFARALKASPTRFVGPAYRGGGGIVAFARR